MESDVLQAPMQAPMQEVREVGIDTWLAQSPLPPKQFVEPTEPAWLHKPCIQFAMLAPNAVAISLGDKGPSTAVCAVCRPSWPCATLLGSQKCS